MEGGELPKSPEKVNVTDHILCMPPPPNLLGSCSSLNFEEEEVFV